MQHALLFVRAIGEHMVTLLAGCGATVALDLFRRYYLKKDFPDKWYAWILVGFLSFAIFQAWAEQFTSAEWRGNKLFELSERVARLDSEVTQKTTTIEGLRGQIMSQQDANSQCLLQLGKATIPVSPQVKTFPLSHIQRQGVPQMEYL